jgi:hypothetical protein
MLGGAMIARLDSKLLHESKITVSAAPAPAAHQSFSRFPWNHRVSLECHTARSFTKNALYWLRIFTGKIQGRLSWTSSVVSAAFVSPAR